jgi:hypothetical protein
MLNFNFICFESRPSKEERKKKKKSENFGFKNSCLLFSRPLVPSANIFRVKNHFNHFWQTHNEKQKSVRPTKLY